MKKFTIAQVMKLRPPLKVQVYGWIDTLRTHKEFIFLVLRENYNLIQIFIDKNNFNNNDLNLSEESYIKVEGELLLNKGVKLGGKEIVAESIEILSKPEEELPISWKFEKYPGIEHRLNHRHISVREPKMQLLFEMISYFCFKLREFSQRNGIIEIQTPKLLGAPSESGAELFELEYFGGKAYLAQSPQFYKQMSIAAGLGKVMEVGPVFRAEPSYTTRHQTEYTGLDFELSPIFSYIEIMEFEENFLKEMFEELQAEYGEKVEEIYGLHIEVPSLPFPKIPFEEVRNILNKEYGIIMEKGEDISSEGEKRIGEYVKKQYGHEFVFMTEYPTKVRPFYHMRNKENSLITNSFDLLYKGLEITTGAQREHRYGILKKQALEKGLTLKTIEFYLNFFKHSCPPHGGIGIGLMRIFMKMLGFNSIHEVTLLPRGPKRIFP